MGLNRITQKTQFSFVQGVADLGQYQRESNGNQSETFIFIDITIDGSGRQGIIIIGSDSAGNILPNSVILKARSGGGVDVWNGNNVKIASLDAQGNFKTKGTITASTIP